MAIANATELQKNIARQRVSNVLQRLQLLMQYGPPRSDQDLVEIDTAVASAVTALTVLVNA